LKKVFIFLLVFLCVVCFMRAQEKTVAEKEAAAVKAAALDYIEGWYEGSSERMARALHPALHKVGVQTYRPGGNVVLSPIGYTAMVELAAMGVGKKVPPEKRNISVKILDLSKNIASVKTVSLEFIDYVLLAKLDGEWKIINVLWEPAE